MGATGIIAEGRSEMTYAETFLHLVRVKQREYWVALQALEAVTGRHLDGSVDFDDFSIEDIDNGLADEDSEDGD